MIRLKFCTIERRDDAVWVSFNDGTSCPATAHMTPHYHVIAHRLGYGDDVWAYTLEHEFAHAFMEEHLHDRPSRVLWALAHGTMLSGREAAYEEIVAQTFQRWLRANERPILSGVNWDRLKAEALALLDCQPSEWDLAQERMARQFEIDRGYEVRPDPDAPSVRTFAA